MATILVVDDDRPIRTIFELYLTSFGYTALTAASDVEALEVARAHPEIQLIILDVVMSGIVAAKLTRELTAVVPGAATLFCSGHPAAEAARLGIDLTAGDFMEKPCRPAELKNRITQLLAKQYANH